MRIIFHEYKKAFRSPILIVLILLFTTYNIYLILSNSYFKDEITVANELAKTYGLNITDESIQRFEQDFHKDIKKLNEPDLFTVTSKPTIEPCNIGFLGH